MGLGHRTPVIAVIGASSAGEDALQIAVEVGEGIASRGWHLVCGGGTGVMKSACGGFGRVRDNGDPHGRNISIGILPVEDDAWANDHVDLVIPTGLGWARNAIITGMASAVVVVGGCSGTLSEIAFAWQMDKPIVAMAGSGGWAERLAGESVDDRRGDKILEASSGAEAMEMISREIGADPS